MVSLPIASMVSRRDILAAARSGEVVLLDRPATDGSCVASAALGTSSTVCEGDRMGCSAPSASVGPTKVVVTGEAMLGLPAIDRDGS